MGEPPQIIVMGGGAAGFFAAITAAETLPDAQVRLLERSAKALGKVRISGGGRCNVTHACFDPVRLISYYPRGGRALRGPFTRFQPHDTVAWFESRGVPLKTEPDGRIFPVSDRSESIIECLQTQAARAGVKLRTNAHLEKIHRDGHRFRLSLGGGEELVGDRLVLATGSNPLGWEWAQALGHSLISPVPSLFTLIIADPRLEGLAGISLPSTEISIDGTRLRQKGAILITHQGLSGPAVLKLSAWGARDFHARDYRVSLRINWVGEPLELLIERLKKIREKHAQNLIAAHNPAEVPRRLWARLVIASGIDRLSRWGEVGNVPLRDLGRQLTEGLYSATGKNMFKEEFVTAGGIPLDEVDFRTMQSKRCPGLYFAGEILDVDGVTGGFNFQNAWTTGWIAGQSAALALKSEAS